MVEARDRYFRRLLHCVQCRKDTELRADIGVLIASLGGLVICYILFEWHWDRMTSESFGLGVLVALVLTTICIPRLRSVVRRIRWRGIVRRLFDEIRRSATDTGSESETWRAIEALRRAAEPLPQWVLKSLSRVYRVSVARIVASMRLTGTEIAQLKRIAAALGLATNAEAAARTSGFLDVFQQAVGNRMDAAQDCLFNQIRIGLDIESSAVEPIRRHETELIEARQIGYADLDPIPSPVRLKGKERCYWRTVAAEVLRAEERDLNEAEKANRGSSVQIGDLLITNSRVLFLSFSAIALDYDAIFLVDVDPERNLVILTTDNRDDALAFCVEKPFIAQALISRFGYTVHA